jgi:4-amino-4-deoxy-L-arabinose transferase-like glycosyltransferase
MSTRLNYSLLLAVILLLALLVRTVPLTYSHFWDETVFLQHAKVILDSRTNFDELALRPPLLSVLYALGFAIWDNVYVANLVQGVVTTLVVLFAFLYVRGVFGVAAAFFSAFLFAFTPYFAEASHQLLTDMPALALMLAAMWLFDKPGPRLALLAGAVYALAIQTRFTSLFLIFYFALDATLSPKKLRNLALLLAGAAAAITPYLLWVRWNYGSFFFPFVMARRIVTEWTAPVPARFYWNALTEIFPYSMWLFFGVGALLPIARWARWRRNGDGARSLASITESSDQTKRQIVLLIWGAAFLVYMLRIPHKEVRYLLPLAIPVGVISALGLAALCRWFARQTTPVRVVGLLLGVAIMIVDYATPFQKLMGPWYDQSLIEPWIKEREVWETVQIARYLREVSTPDDTIYAAHNFPVLAFYSERRTVSLLPIQENFNQAWPDLMKQPGFLVYFHPDKIKEIHSINPSLKPDRRFLENCPNFRVDRVFPTATVYRYLPTH